MLCRMAAATAALFVLISKMAADLQVSRRQMLEPAVLLCLSMAFLSSCSCRVCTPCSMSLFLVIQAATCWASLLLAIAKASSGS